MGYRAGTPEALEWGKRTTAKRLEGRQRGRVVAVSFRLSEEEAARLKAKAAALGLSQATFIMLAADSYQAEK